MDDLALQLWAFANFALVIACAVFAFFQFGDIESFSETSATATLACAAAGGALTAAAWRVRPRLLLSLATLVLAAPFVYLVLFVAALGTD